MSEWKYSNHCHCNSVNLHRWSTILLGKGLWILVSISVKGVLFSKAIGESNVKLLPRFLPRKKVVKWWITFYRKHRLFGKSLKLCKPYFSHLGQELRLLQSSFLYSFILHGFIKHLLCAHFHIKLWTVVQIMDKVSLHQLLMQSTLKWWLFSFVSCCCIFSFWCQRKEQYIV